MRFWWPCQQRPGRPPAREPGAGRPLRRVLPRRGRRLTWLVGWSLLSVALTGAVLEPPSGAASATGPTITVSDVTVLEPTGGTVDATFVVTLSQAATQPVTVRYRTADGSATAPADYRPASGTLTFAPGETSQTVTVKVAGDTVPEANEVFYLELTDATNGMISQARGTATIVDQLPTITISDLDIAEPDPGGIERALFQVTLSTPAPSTARVDFATADGSAVAGEDYEPVRGTLTFRPGESSKTISVAVKNDLASSQNEVFFVKLSRPRRAQLARAVGQATIVENDRTLAVMDATLGQPGPGEAGEALFQVLLSEPTSGSTIFTGFPTSQPVAVDFTTVDGSAVAGQDYQPVSGTLVFRPGEASKTIAVVLLNNGVPGPDKSFYVELLRPVNATLSRALAQGYVVGSNRTITIDDTSATDLDTPGTFATFVVTLSAPTSAPVSVQYATANGNAVAGVDYQAQQGTLMFAPGQASATIRVPILSDATDANPDTPETFYLELSNPTNAVVARPRATATIYDNDKLISIDDTTVIADRLTPVDATFTVTLSQTPAAPVLVNFTTVDGTATAPADYQATAGTVTFPAGQTAATIAVHVAAQPGTGPDKTFSVHLSGAINATIVRADARATILTRGRGYWLVASDGGIFSFGDARFFGSTGAMTLNQPIVGMAATPTGNGYWMVASDGGIFAFGDAGFYGSAGDQPLQRPIVGMASTPTGRGYWLVASDGGIFAYGDARFLGSTGGLPLHHPVVGMATTPGGNGYWLVASDGGIFSFGDARYRGSTGATHLSQSILGMAATPTGAGYWLVAADGGLFAFGDAPFVGSAADLKEPIIGITATPSGRGYWLVASYGAVFPFGDARSLGSTGSMSINAPIVAMVRVP